MQQILISWSNAENPKPDYLDVFGTKPSFKKKKPTKITCLCSVYSMGVTKRCRLSCLTKSALVYERKWEGGGGVARSQQISTALHRSPSKLWRFKSIINMCILYILKELMYLFSAFHSSGLRKGWRPARVRLGWLPCWARARLVGGGDAADQEKVMIKGGLQRDVVYFSWPIAPSYTSPNAGGLVGGGGGCWVSATEYTAVNIMWHGTHINFADLTTCGCNIDGPKTASKSSFHCSLLIFYKFQKISSAFVLVCNCISCVTHFPAVLIAL
jgi:hypothetical protein